MLLLPSEQTNAQLTALRRLVETGTVTLSEPCNCGSQIRHNNGGNYHTIVEFRMDAGLIYRMETFTGVYGPPDDWHEVRLAEAIEEIASKAAWGW